jgi:hypothetical protein
MLWPFITSKSLPERTVTLECNAKERSTNHFQFTQGMNRAWITEEQKMAIDSHAAYHRLLICV